MTICLYDVDYWLHLPQGDWATEPLSTDMSLIMFTKQVWTQMQTRCTLPMGSKNFDK